MNNLKKSIKQDRDTATTIVHEFCHRYLDFTGDTYCSGGKCKSLKPSDALENPDSYAYFAADAQFEKTLAAIKAKRKAKKPRKTPPKHERQEVRPTPQPPPTQKQETRSEVHQRVLRGLIEIVRSNPLVADRGEPLFALFRSVPSDQSMALHDRLEPGSPKDDFAQYLKNHFAPHREAGLEILRTN